MTVPVSDEETRLRLRGLITDCALRCDSLRRCLEATVASGFRAEAAASALQASCQTLQILRDHLAAVEHRIEHGPNRAW